jgi:hypothetical protein
MADQSDVELLTRWGEWLKALDAEMCARHQREAERRHKAVEKLQQSIAKTASQGLVGVGVKLALTAFLEGFEDGPDGAPGRSAYQDTARLLDRDFLTEAETIIEGAREREFTLQKKPNFISTPTGTGRRNSRREEWPIIMNWHATSPRRSWKS